MGLPSPPAENSMATLYVVTAIFPGCLSFYVARRNINQQLVLLQLTWLENQSPLCQRTSLSVVSVRHHANMSNGV